MFGVPIKRLVAILIAIACIAAGWRISGFYVVTTKKTDLYRRVDSGKLRTTQTLQPGVVLRAAKRSEYKAFQSQGKTLSRYNRPDAFAGIPQGINSRLSTPYLSVGLLGQRIVAAADVDPFHTAEQHYLFELLGWFLYGVGGLIIAREIYLARRPASSTK